MKRASLAAVSFLLTFGCNGDTVPTSPPPTPVVPVVSSVSVSLSPLVQTIPPGQTARLTATARYSDGSTKDVPSQATWSSSQSNVATVSGGAVNGIALGRTTIRVNFERWSSAMNIVIEPDGTFILTGKVTEGGGVVVGGASVEVIGGAPNQVITNSTGAYELFGIGGTAILRFSKTGYFDERRSVTMSANQSLDVEITPRVAPANVAGTYRVTFTASPSCQILSAEQKIRTYTARIDQDAAGLHVTLSDANFVPMRNAFAGKVFGDSVTLDIGMGDFYYYYDGSVVQERLSSNQLLTMWGTVTASAMRQSISGALVGGFTLRTGSGRAMSCSATDNQVVFTRQ